jgi:two-component sensor histidine kinase
LLPNPLVAGAFGLRFYVDVPLRTCNGFDLGTLCGTDREPRGVSEQQITQLHDLASLVVDQMELHSSERRAMANLSHAVAEKDPTSQTLAIMAKEIDQRVMNSLQLVPSLLNLQSRHLGSSDAAVLLVLAAGWVSAIARVHQHIYNPAPAGGRGMKVVSALVRLKRVAL